MERRRNLCPEPALSPFSCGLLSPLHFWLMLSCHPREEVRAPYRDAGPARSRGSFGLLRPNTGQAWKPFDCSLGVMCPGMCIPADR